MGEQYVEGLQPSQRTKAIAGDFLGAMIDKIVANDEEKGQEGWLGRNCTVESLIDMLEDEVTELKHAFSDCDPHEVANECVDIANFAMMIRSRIEQIGCTR